MFYIYWMNQHHRDWVGDYGFDTRAEAEQYLEEQGYIMRGGWYKREPIGWEGNTKALIGELQKYKKGSD